MQPLERVTLTTIEVLKCIYSVEGSGVWGLEISKRTGLKTGTVYPILERLENLGWVSSEWEITEERNGPRRRTYKLTPDALEEMHGLSKSISGPQIDLKAWNLALRRGWAG